MLQITDISSATNLKVQNDAAADGGLTEQEIKELDNIEGLISRTALENKLKSNKLLSIPKNINTDSISLYKIMTMNIHMLYQCQMTSATYILLLMLKQVK